MYDHVFSANLREQRVVPEIISQDIKKKIHFDKDEASKTLISPIIGCIYYPKKEEFNGGFLEIYEEKEPTRIKAKFNRLIIFDVGKIPHAVSTVTGGTRTSMAINLWNKKPSHLN